MTFRMLVAWHIHRVVFLPIYFSNCCSVDHNIVCAISGHYNKSFFTHFYVFSSPCIDSSTVSSMLASPLPFLDTYSQSMSSLGCKVLCMVISFLVLWFICWSSPIHFKNGPKYLTKETTQAFIPLMRFLLQRLVSRRLLVRLRYPFLIFFFHLHLFDGTIYQPLLSGRIWHKVNF